MFMDIGKHILYIHPENAQDVAYLEDTLGIGDEKNLAIVRKVYDPSCKSGHIEIVRKDRTK